MVPCASLFSVCINTLAGSDNYIKIPLKNLLFDIFSMTINTPRGHDYRRFHTFSMDSRVSVYFSSVCLISVRQQLRISTSACCHKDKQRRKCCLNKPSDRENFDIFIMFVYRQGKVCSVFGICARNSGMRHLSSDFVLKISKAKTTFLFFLL